MKNVNERYLNEAKTALLDEIIMVENWRLEKSNPQREKINAPEEETKNALTADELNILFRYVEILPVEDVLFRTSLTMDQYSMQELRFKLSTYGWSKEVEPEKFVRDFVSFLLRRWTSDETVVSWDK